MSIQFLEKELTLVFPEVLQTIRDELRFYNGLLVPVSGQLPDGVEFIKQYRQDYTGMSARFNGISTDIPTVDITMTSYDWRVAQWVIGANWNETEITYYQRAQSAGEITRSMGPVQMKMLAASRIIGENINKAIAFGDTNFKGFLNHPDVPLVTETTSPYTLTAPNLYTYFNSLLGTLAETSLIPANQFTLLLPPALYRKLTLPFDTTSPNITPFGMLTDPAKGIYFADIEMLPELSYTRLEAGGVFPSGTNKDRFVIYQRTPEVVSRMTSPLRTTEPLRVQQLHWNVAMHQRSSEVMVRQPMRILYRDFAKPA